MFLECEAVCDSLQHQILHEGGSLNYPQLIKFILPLIHRNGSPERGFSINKILIDVQKDDRIVALRLRLFAMFYIYMYFSISTDIHHGALNTSVL